MGVCRETNFWDTWDAELIKEIRYVFEKTCIPFLFSRHLFHVLGTPCIMGNYFRHIATVRIYNFFFRTPCIQIPNFVGNSGSNTHATISERFSYLYHRRKQIHFYGTPCTCY